MKKLEVIILSITILSMLVTRTSSNERNVEFYDNISIAIHPCINDECLNFFIPIFRDDSSKCAFYSINHPVAISMLKNKSLIVDESNYWGMGIPRKSDGLMHHKYCYNSTSIVLGSYNPTIPNRDTLNIVVNLNSSRIFSIFEKNFQGMLQNLKINPYYIVHDNESSIEICFTPSPTCRWLLLKTLGEAEQEVYVQLYVLSDPLIIEELRTLAKKNISITGIIESSSANNKEAVLLARYTKIVLEDSPLLIHSKLFIIDNKTIVTGSYNPSINAFTKNDEDLLIVHNTIIAKNLRREIETMLSLDES